MGGWVQLTSLRGWTGGAGFEFVEANDPRVPCSCVVGKGGCHGHRHTLFIDC